ncbi:hypothetical protein Glove_86g78 [Diversispora epigaea]|uniref:Protein kinase domain-containing protein n=1 Tax=Diversispora epigaea TaxID=1348612 RepID=A0A397J7A2_9GLOM|nr:hypothetical protein Glove_86g78 [Diversispora epigaea]
MSQEIEKIVYCPAGSQINNIRDKLQWIPYENFQNIEHIADGGGIKQNWNFIKQDWRCHLIDCKFALKEIKDSRYDIAKFLEMIKTVNSSGFIAMYYGIQKILIHKTTLLLVHCDFHSGNSLILNRLSFRKTEIVIDLGLCEHESDLILKADKKNNKIYGSIPYIPPEVLKGNEFTREGDIFSFGEMVTAQRPFANQAHDTYLIIDICNGVRPKVPDFMLSWIPEWYLDLMYRCWSDDPSERPTADELTILFRGISDKLINYIMNDDVMQQLEIADENQKNISKSQKQELFELFSYSSKLHPQSCYISRYIYTLHGLHDILEEIKYGKSSDPNLLLKSNEPTTLNANNRNFDCINLD